MDLYTPVTPGYKEGDNKFTGQMNKIAVDFKPKSAADEATEETEKDSSRMDVEGDAGKYKNLTIKQILENHSKIPVGSTCHRGQCFSFTSIKCPRLQRA